MAVTRYIQAAVTEAEYKEIHKAAIDAGMKLSPFVKAATKFYCRELAKKNTVTQETNHHGQD